MGGVGRTLRPIGRSTPAAFVFSMLRGIFNFLFSCAFVAFLPAFWLCAEIWGSSDERWLLHWCVIVLSPFCAAIWLIVLRKGKWSSFLVIPLGYLLVAFLLRSGMVRP